MAMILNRIEQIEARVRNSGSLSDSQKDSLLTQLTELKAEAAAVPRGGDEPLPVESSVEDEGPLTPILNELAAAVDGLEASHPRLTQLTNQISLALANMGI